MAEAPVSENSPAELDSALTLPASPGAIVVAVVAALLWIGGLVLLSQMHYEHTLPEVTFAVGDLVALPGEEIELVARLEKRLPGGTVIREGIEVGLPHSTEDEEAGRVRTDRSGIARRPIVAPEARGLHRFAVHLDEPHLGTPGVYFDPRLIVIEPGTPLVICDLEGTLVFDEESEFDEKSPAVLTALKAIADARTLILLHSGEPTGADRIRGVLLRKNLSSVPVIASRGPDEDVEAYRRRVLDDLTTRFGTPEWGITGSDAACRAMRAASIATVRVGDAPCEGAVAAPGWGAVRQTIIGEAPTPRRP